jgi:5,10-methylenetetrahydromethanopterin reductase
VATGQPLAATSAPIASPPVIEQRAPRCEYWWSTGPPLRAGGLAERLVAQGWDGLLLSDSQNLAPDTFVALATAAAATAGTGFGLGTGVTNPVTRHPAAALGAIATVAAASGGPTVLGVGRGDSAMHSLGRPPAPVAQLAWFLERAAAYLRGAAVAGEGDPVSWMAAVPLPPLRLDVAATGPKVTALAGRVADMVTFAVGADVDRLRRGIEVARQARADAGGDPDSLALGAYVNVAAHPDAAVARRVVQGRASNFARFSVLPGAARDDFAGHGDSRSAHAEGLDDAFLQRFAVYGPPAHCVDRLAALLDAVPLGRLVVASGHRGVDASERDETAACIAEEVLPHLPR